MKNSINKNTKVELFTKGKRGGQYGSSAIVEVGQVFNFGGFLMELSKEQEEFVKSLDHREFKEIPSDMLDGITSDNFRCYLKLK